MFTVYAVLYCSDDGCAHGEHDGARVHQPLSSSCLARRSSAKGLGYMGSDDSACVSSLASCDDGDGACRGGHR